MVIGLAKVYVVWKGRTPGIYNSWEECKKQVDGFSGAKYKSFKSMEVAKDEYRKGGTSTQSSRTKPLANQEYAEPNQHGKRPSGTFLTIDAAFSGKTKALEWRGVLVENGQHRQVFHSGVHVGGSANIGEFLAIIDALEFLLINNLAMPVFSDSWNAQKWLRARKHASKASASPELQAIISAKVHALQSGRYDQVLKVNTVYDWKTSDWGEIPADFGRK